MNFDKALGWADLRVLPVTEAELQRAPLTVRTLIWYERPGVSTLKVHSLISASNFLSPWVVLPWSSSTLYSLRGLGPGVWLQRALIDVSST